jgi:hypothetical protein
VVGGVRLTDGINGTIVYRPSSPIRSNSMDGENLFLSSVVQRIFYAAWLANGCALVEGQIDEGKHILDKIKNVFPFCFYIFNKNYQN